MPTAKERASLSERTLEQRVESLEFQLAELRDALRRAKKGTGKDWRRTAGAFTDDEGMKEILHEAMRLREADRQRTQPDEGNGQ